MRAFMLALFILILFVNAPVAPAQNKRTVIAASTVFDGKGHIVHNTRIVMRVRRLLPSIQKPVLSITIFVG
jgi:hypothetical protein